MTTFTTGFEDRGSTARASLLEAQRSPFAAGVARALRSPRCSRRTALGAARHCSREAALSELSKESRSARSEPELGSLSPHSRSHSSSQRCGGCSARPDRPRVWGSTRSPRWPLLWSRCSCLSGFLPRTARDPRIWPRRFSAARQLLLFRLAIGSWRDRLPELDFTRGSIRCRLAGIGVLAFWEAPRSSAG